MIACQQTRGEGGYHCWNPLHELPLALWHRDLRENEISLPVLASTIGLFFGRRTIARYTRTWDPHRCLNCTRFLPWFSSWGQPLAGDGETFTTVPSLSDCSHAMFPLTFKVFGGDELSFVHHRIGYRWVTVNGNTHTQREARWTTRTNSKCRVRLFPLSLPLVYPCAFDCPRWICRYCDGCSSLSAPPLQLGEALPVSEETTRLQTFQDDGFIYSIWGWKTHALSTLLSNDDWHSRSSDILHFKSLWYALRPWDVVPGHWTTSDQPLQHPPSLFCTKFVDRD